MSSQSNSSFLSLRAQRSFSLYSSNHIYSAFSLGKFVYVSRLLEDPTHSVHIPAIPPPTWVTELSLGIPCRATALHGELCLDSSLGTKYMPLPLYFSIAFFHSSLVDDSYRPSIFSGIFSITTCLQVSTIYPNKSSLPRSYSVTCPDNS